MVVVDNNVLSSLAKIERLQTLDAVLNDVATTVSVIEELHRDSVSGYEFVDRIDGIKQYDGGWLGVISPSDAELQLTEAILDRSLSYTDAELIAVADHRTERLLTDDGHVGEIAMSRGIETWDLTLFLRAACETGAIETASELQAVMADLRRADYYEFSDDDETYLFDAFEP